jgi:hypothetical protein
MHPHEEIEQALSKAQGISNDGIVRSKNLSAATRSVLVDAGFLMRLVRGWYALQLPEARGSSTAWYSVFWPFLCQYLPDRFGNDGYCLSPQSSLDMHTGETLIPDQLVVLTGKQSNVTLKLPFDTSVLMYMDKSNFPSGMESIRGLNIMPLAVSLARVSPVYFQNKPRNIEIALSLLPSPADVSRELVRIGSVSAAARIAGAYRHLGNDEAQKMIIEDMASAGYRVKPANPFIKYEPVITSRRFNSPYAPRVMSLWKDLRGQIIPLFPKLLHEPVSAEAPAIIEDIRTLSRDDAYHSLSIEGYRVTDELIARVRAGGWDPLNNRTDSANLDALAAQGYNRALNLVMDAVPEIMNGANPGLVLRKNIQRWYRELFLPISNAGLRKAEDLVGYRGDQVYIRNAKHVPPPFQGVTDAMDMFLDLIKDESNGGVRAILGHYIFAYIHPYMDGNGRIARFIMNLMLVTAGYPWTIIRSTERVNYMKTLDLVATSGDIKPFTAFVMTEMEYLACPPASQ